MYLEVVRPERIVYRHMPEKDAQAADFEATVTFVEEDRKTRLTMRALFPAAAPAYMSSGSMAPLRA